MARRSWKRDRKGRFARTGSSSKGSSKKSYSKKKGSSKKKSNRRRNIAIGATAVVAAGVVYGASRRKGGGGSIAPTSMPRGALVGPSKMKALGPGKSAVTNTRPSNSKLKSQAASRKAVGRDQGRAMGLTVTRKKAAKKAAAKRIANRSAAKTKQRNSPNARLKRAAANRKRFGQDLRAYRGGGTTIYPGGGW